jgi:phage repressor protein C with HTH and peptisase S24 domain
MRLGWRSSTPFCKRVVRASNLLAVVPLTGEVAPRQPLPSMGYMCRLLKVSGLSLWPQYDDGDYVLIAPPALAGGIRRGDIVVFHRPDTGHTTIKQVDHFLPNGALFVLGTHDHSVDSRHFGPIARTTLLGKVIWHVRR